LRLVQAGGSNTTTPYPVFFLLEVFNGVYGNPIVEREKLWFMVLGFGSGNPAIAARLMGYNVTVISTPLSPNEVVANRLVHKTCPELWGDTFKEILPSGAPRNAVDSAMSSFSPAMVADGFVPIDGSTASNMALEVLERGMFRPMVPMETDIITGTPLTVPAATDVPAETEPTAQMAAGDHMASDAQMARDTQEQLEGSPQQPRRSSRGRPSLGTATE
jgi:hypothetical protein